MLVFFNRKSSIVNRQSIVLVLLLLFLLPLTSCARSRIRTELRRNYFFAEILMREDRRFIGQDSFFEENLLANPFPEVRQWCALALGRIASPRALPWLYEALRARDALLRAASAFAIGEIEDRSLLEEQHRSTDPRAAAELTRILDDPSLAVRMRAIEALGKIGGSAEATEIARRLEAFTYSGSPGERAFLGYAIAAMTRLQDPSAIPVLERLAGSGDPDIQWRAADALTCLRSRTSGPLFVRLLSSLDPDVQAYAARGLGITGDPGLATLLLPLLPPRHGQTGIPIPLSVRICALQALGELGNPAVIPSIKAALSADPLDAGHPDQLNFAIEAAAAIGRIGAIEGEAVLSPLLKSPQPVPDSALVALARILKGKPERFFRLADSNRFQSPSAVRARARAMVELGGDEAVEELYRMLQRTMKQASGSEPETIPEILTSLAKTDAPRLQEILTLFLGSQDTVPLRAAVSAYRPEPGAKTPWAPVLRAFTACAASGDVETRAEILKHLKPWVREAPVQQTLLAAMKDPEHAVRLAAAGLLRGAGMTDIAEDFGPSSASISEPVSYALAVDRKKSTIAILDTTQGVIEIELFRENAPATAASFVFEAKRGRFDGLEFTRTGPFLLVGRGRAPAPAGRPAPSEVHMRPFERGSVGMALSGSDSRADSFFIALSPQPHLDGIHTCFGRVISGLQAAGRMAPGGRIKRIRIKDTISFHDYIRY